MLTAWRSRRVALSPVLNAGPPGPASLILALEGQASVAVTRRLPAQHQHPGGRRPGHGGPVSVAWVESGDQSVNSTVADDSTASPPTLDRVIPTGLKRVWAEAVRVHRIGTCGRSRHGFSTACKRQHQNTHPKVDDDHRTGVV